MKIKKTFQGSIPENKILNSHSTSQTDTYSCEKINEITKNLLNRRLKLGGKSEQATENEASPSPDNPIRNVGDNIDLYDINNITYPSAQIKVDIINDELIITRTAAGGGTHVSNLIEGLKIGKKYTIRSNGAVYIYKDKVYGSSYARTSDASKGFTFLANQTSYVISNIIGSEVIPNVGDTFNCGKIKLEEGSVAKPWTPYNCGSIDYKVENKNLVKNIFNEGYTTILNGITYVILKSGAIKVTGTSTAMSELRINTDFDIKKGEYVISGGAENVMFQLIETGVYSKECYANEVNFTLNEDKTAQTLRLRISAGETVNTIVYPMIRKKDASNSYIEHQEKTIQFPLSEGQVLHEGDYIDRDGIHQNRKTVIFDGTESWELQWDNTNYDGFRVSIDDILIITELDKKTKLLSNYFKAYSQSDLADLNGNGICQRINQKQIIIKTDKANSVATLKTYLATQYANGTPVTVEYELEKEIVTPLTKEQIEVFYELQKAKYVDKMELTCLNEIEPTLTDIEKSLEESLLDVEKLLAMLSLNS